MADIQALENIFSRVIERNRLSHGYIFFGESFTAQLKFVQSLASFLETNDWKKTTPLFDTFILSADKEAGIDAMRPIRSFLWQTKLRALRRTVIIAEAERLSVHAQNALLKIVEDPPSSALVLFTAKHPESLITPLLSRLQKVFVSIPYTYEDEFLSTNTNQEKKIVETYVNRLFHAQIQKERSDTIKELLEEDHPFLVRECIASMLDKARKDPQKNMLFLKEVVYRWALMQQYNTNRKLQFEAMFLPQNKIYG